MAKATTDSFAGGRYKVKRLLGRGGMAAVYLAHDSELDRPVAVKVLGEPLALDEAFVERFRREATTAAGLSHPNVVQVFDTGEDAGRLFIVMECVEGDGLDALLAREEKLDPDRVVELGQQACEALQYAHEQGVVHRDVKPANLLLRKDGILKVADFGIALPAEATQLTEVGTILGTAAYLSPEQARGEPATPASDLYSLGVVLYELLTGKPPLVIENLAQLAARDGAPVPPVRESAPEVPVPVEAAVMRCLARNPRYRPGSASELAADLRTRATEPTVPLGHLREPMPSPSEARTRLFQREIPIQRGRWLGTRWLIAAVVVLALAALMVAITTNDSARRRHARTTPAASAQSVRPVPRASDPGGQAANLAQWIRDHSAPAG
jgi:eukaryotic-like serine/threonine-protein kinase